MLTRKEANLEILRQLIHYAKMNPDQRFGQILRNTGCVLDKLNQQTWTNEWANHFDEEPQKMLERMKQIKKEGF